MDSFIHILTTKHIITLNSQLSTQNIDSSVSDVNSSRAFIPMMELPFELSRGLHTAME